MSHNTCMWGSEDSDSKLVLSFHQGFQGSISGLQASTLTLWACLVVQHWTSGPIASTCQVLDYRHTHQAQYMWNRRWNPGLRTQPRGWVDMLKKHQWALENVSCRVDLNSPTASPEGCKQVGGWSIRQTPICDQVSVTWAKEQSLWDRCTRSQIPEKDTGQGASPLSRWRIHCYVGLRQSRVPDHEPNPKETLEKSTLENRVIYNLQKSRYSGLGL